jgi:6-phosphogluconolactonase
MIRIFNDLEGISQAAAGIFLDAAEEAIDSRGQFSVALAGGNTPRRLYGILASSHYHHQIRWQAVHVFWGDERCVPADDPRSNFRMARETLLDLVPISAQNIHPIQGDQPPKEAAIKYESELRDFFSGQNSSFDLVLLGLGENAHTVSLFPHTSVLTETKRWVSEVYIEELQMSRITLTAPLINTADQVVFLVSGADKAVALQKVLEGTYQPQEYPAQLIHPNGAHPIWLVDKAAGEKMAFSSEQDLDN